MIDPAAGTNGVSAITSMISSGTNTMFTVFWFGRRNWNYAVQYSSTLVPPVSWQIVPGCTNIMGSDMLTNCTDRTVLVVTNRYYLILGY